ncbi:MAG TPA: DUF1501 domain-containing protein [Verrucomicrobiae bacterium]|jgi:uncharacterized protein (DUF1501 family)
MASAQTFITGNGDRQNALVVIFLRGGADGLNLVAPVEDDGYYKARPRIAISKANALKLDGFFGLNPLLKPLHTLYEQGALAIVHATGSEDDTRSHFEAQDLMEHGGVVGGGWLGRFLRARPGNVSGPLAAVAFGRAMPESFRGAPSATVMESFDDFLLGGKSTALASALGRLYGAEENQIGHAGRDTLGALKRIEILRDTLYQPANGAEYGRDDFSKRLLQLARLVKARVGMEAAAVDLGGWDSHTSQGLIMDPLMTRLATGLAAFHRDLGEEMARTTVVVMTEFGRRLAENSAFGTDHGRGSVMFALGGGIRGGRVLGRWPGLKNEVLEGPGDVPVATNYRNVLAPLLQKHSSDVKLAQVFPQFALEPLPLYS